MAMAKYAVSSRGNGQEPSWRSVQESDELAAGEIIVSVIPDNPVWDDALNSGDGGVRSMTEAEIAALHAAAMVVQTQAETDRAALVAFRAGSGALSNAELTDLLRALLRLQGF